MSQNKYQPLVEDADNDSRKSEDLDHAHKVSLVESLVEDGSSKPLGTIQAVLRQCAKRPNAKALLTQWSVAGLFMALFRMLCREDFLGIADLEEVYAVVALMLTNPDLHREFVDTWIRCTVQHGVRDAMLFIMCRCLKVRGFIHTLLDLNMVNLLQDLYSLHCVIPRKPAESPRNIKKSPSLRPDGEALRSEFQRSYSAGAKALDPPPPTAAAPPGSMHNPLSTKMSGTLLDMCFGTAPPPPPHRPEPTVDEGAVREVPPLPLNGTANAVAGLQLTLPEAAALPRATAVAVAAAAQHSAYPSRAALRARHLEGKSRPSLSQLRNAVSDAAPDSTRGSALTDLKKLAMRAGNLYISHDVTNMLAIKRQADAIRNAMQTPLGAALAPQAASPPSGSGPSGPSGGFIEGVLISHRQLKSSRVDTQVYGARDRRFSRKCGRGDELSFYYTVCGTAHDRSGGSSVACQRLLLLYLLRTLTLEHACRATSRNPVNMMVHEFESLAGLWPHALPSSGSAEGAEIAESDEASVRACFGHIVMQICCILRHYSLQVEARYLPMWLDCPRRFASIQFVERYKKYDLLLWRLVTAVDGVLGKPFMDWALLHHLLFNLAHYLRSCQTARRALCFHAAHLCIEQLEQLLCMCQQRDCVDVDAAKTVYYLLDIFDSMMYSEKPAEVTEVLKSLFLERSSRHFQWLQGYGRLMLRDTHVASELAARNSKDEDILESDALTGTVPTAEGEADVEADVGDALFEWQEALGSCTAPMLLPHLFSLERCRQRLVLHQHALLVLMEGMEDEEYEGQSNRDLLLVFMPFVNTTDGEVLKFLSDNVYDQYLVKVELLKFLGALLNTKDCPFLLIQSFCDTYIRFHYLSFLRSYTTNPDMMRTTQGQRDCKLCELHLKVLLAFSVHKTEFIAKLMYTLQVVPFLTHEVQLESTAHERRQHYLGMLEEQRQQQQKREELKQPDAKPRLSPTKGPAKASSPQHDQGPAVQIPKLMLPDFIAQAPNPLNNGGKTPEQDLEAGAKPKLQMPVLASSVVGGEVSPKAGAKSPGSPKAEAPAAPAPTLFKKPFVPPLKLGAHVKGHCYGVQGGFVEEASFTSSSTFTTPLRLDPPQEPDLSFGPEVRTEVLSPHSTHSSRQSRDTAVDGHSELRESLPSMPSMPAEIGSCRSPVHHLGSLKGDAAEKGFSTLDEDVVLPSVRKNSFAATATKPLMLNHINSATSLSLSVNVAAPFKDDATFYATERACCRIYVHMGVHLHIVLLLLSLLVSPHHILDDRYCDSFPSHHRKVDVLYILHQHLNHVANKCLGNVLYRRIVRYASPSSTFVLLTRLLCTALFDPSLYVQKVRIAAGAYGTIWNCNLMFPPMPQPDKPDRPALEPASASLVPPAVTDADIALASQFAKDTVAIKLLPLSKTIMDHCVLFDIFNEVLILHKFRGESGVCQMYDFGVDHEHYYIIMKMYKCSLRQWRLSDTKSLHERFPLYLNIFKMIVRQVCYMHSREVLHYDLKCDNILLDFGAQADGPAVDEDPSAPPFMVVLADFGESVIGGAPGDEAGAGTNWGFTTRGRGTEVVRSPEMLQAFKKDGDRRKRGHSMKSDVWSLGCLFYELLTTEYLFQEESYMKFWNRVCSVQSPALEEEQRAKVGLCPLVLDLLNLMLTKECSLRPTAQEVYSKVCSVTEAQIAKACADLRAQAADAGAAEEQAPVSPGPRSPQGPKSPKVIRYVGQDGATSSKSDAFALLLRTYVAPTNVHRSLPLQCWCSPPAAAEPTTSPLFPPSLSFSISSRSLMEYRVSSPLAPQCLGSRKFNMVCPVLKDQLYLGVSSMAHSYEFLYSLGVTHVVNLSSHAPQQPANFTYNSLTLDMYAVQEANPGLGVGGASFRVAGPWRSKGKQEGTGGDLSEACTGLWLKAVVTVSTALRRGAKVFVYACDASPLGQVFVITYLMLLYGSDSYTAYTWLKRQCHALSPSAVVWAHNLLRCMRACSPEVARRLQPRVGRPFPMRHSGGYRCLCGQVAYASRPPVPTWADQLSAVPLAVWDLLTEHVMESVQGLAALYDLRILGASPALPAAPQPGGDGPDPGRWGAGLARVIGCFMLPTVPAAAAAAPAPRSPFVLVPEEAFTSWADPKHYVKQELPCTSPSLATPRGPIITPRDISLPSKSRSTGTLGGSGYRGPAGSSGPEAASQDLANTSCCGHECLYCRYLTHISLDLPVPQNGGAKRLKAVFVNTLLRYDEAFIRCHEDEDLRPYLFQTFAVPS